jgi:hypothetical protein
MVFQLLVELLGVTLVELLVAMSLVESQEDTQVVSPVELLVAT